MSKYILFEENNTINIELNVTPFYKGEFYDFYASNFEFIDYVFCIYHNKALQNQDFLDVLSFLVRNNSSKNKELPLPRYILKKNGLVKGVAFEKPQVLKGEFFSFPERMKVFKKSRLQLTQYTYYYISQVKEIFENCKKIGKRKSEITFFSRFDPNLFFINEKNEYCYLGFNDICFKKMTVEGTKHAIFSPNNEFYEISLYPMLGNNSFENISLDNQYKDLVDYAISILMDGYKFKDSNGTLIFQSDSNNSYKEMTAFFIWSFFPDQFKKSIVEIYTSNKDNMYIEFFEAFKMYTNSFRNDIDSESFKIHPSRPNKFCSKHIITKKHPVTTFLGWFVVSFLSLSLIGVNVEISKRLSIPFIIFCYVLVVILFYLLSAVYFLRFYKLVFFLSTVLGGYLVYKITDISYLLAFEYALLNLKYEKGIILILISMLTAVWITVGKRKIIDLKNNFFAREKK